MAPEQTKARQLATWLAPLLGLAVWASLRAYGLNTDIAITAGVTVWTATWWISEAVPIPVASLLPIALLPLLGILTPNEVAAAYGSPLILLLLGGFMLSQAMQKSGVHRRLALLMLGAFGRHGQRGLVFGFMAAAASLSMWISNTATTLMLLPIAIAVLESQRRADDGPDDQHGRLTVAVLLGVAYAASIGSLGTPIGTPPNLVFMQVFRDTTGDEIAFSQFMRWGLPVAIVAIPLVGLWLTRGLRGTTPQQIQAPGAWRQAEVRTLIVFVITALAWVTRTEPFGGWRTWLGLPNANDASVALLAVVTMFVIPSGNLRNDRLLDWEHANRIPWGILILFGSGIAIAKAFANSGLSELIGASVATAIASWPLIATIAIVTVTVMFLTEITSNTATATLLMPILAAAGVGAGLDPKLVMLPAAMAASCAFMLPVATGPNAVVFGSGKLTVAKMAREGLVVNLICALVITICCVVYFS